MSETHNMTALEMLERNQQEWLTSFLARDWKTHSNRVAHEVALLLRHRRVDATTIFAVVHTFLDATRDRGFDDGQDHA